MAQTIPVLATLAAWLRSYPSTAAGLIRGNASDAETRLAAAEASIAGLAADITLTCLSGDAIGSWMYVSTTSTGAKADADDAAKIPAVGVIISKPTTTSCVVRFSGLATGLSGLTAATVYYLDTTAGGIVSTAPAAPDAVPVGIAITTTSILVFPIGLVFSVLKSTSAKFGADMIGYQDSGNKTTAARVATVLDALLVEGTSTIGKIELSPAMSWQLLTGAPMAIFADGTTTVPGLDFDSSKCACVRWNNDAAPAAITRSFGIPSDADITANMVLHVRVAKVGATNNAGNTTTMAIGLFNQVDAALITADTDFGGASSALTPSATSLTIQNLTRTLTASDLAAYPASVTITMKPTAGTLDTDDLLFVDAYILYTRKLRTS